MFKRFAKYIAKSAAEIIGCGVLVTDENAFIIACSDESRLGEFHEPSIRVMQENVPMETTEKEASALLNVYPGYTLPIQLFNNVVGSISITGAPEDVARYGRLVQKHAEIMLREQAYLESSMLKERELRDFIKNVASFDVRNRNNELILMQGKELGYDLSWCKIALIIEMKRWDIHSSEAAFRILQGEVRSSFSNPRNVICFHENYRITILFSPSVSGSADDVSEISKSLVSSLIKSLSDKGINIDVAIGFAAEDLAGLARSLRSSRNVLRLARQLGAHGIIAASSFTAETLLDLLPHAQREEFAMSTLKNLTDRTDYEDIKETFLTWCEYPFASGEAAEKMSMHRNSLQYRLKKIRTLTGKDPWNFKDAFELWISFVLLDMQ